MKVLVPLEVTFVLLFLTGWFTLLAISKPSFKIHIGSEYIYIYIVQRSTDQSSSKAALSTPWPRLIDLTAKKRKYVA